MNLCYLFVVRVCDEELWRDKKFFIIGKVHVLLLRIKKRSILKKRLKKRSDEKKNMENTHTRVNMGKKRGGVAQKM